MNPLFDPYFGWLVNKAGDVAISSFGLYRLLFAPFVSAGFRDWTSRRRACAVALQARTRVPAYRAFLEQHAALRVRHFSELPVMDKANYIQRWTLEELCLGGELPKHGAVIDESSGSTGTATNWIRGPGERFATRRLIQYSARATFGSESFVLLNAFALGPWATGMNVSMSLVDRCILKSIGPDIKKVIASLEQLGPKHRYVITGYPPFLKTLVDTADIDWARYDICAVVGGEGMSEPLRAALNRCFRKTISSFGASDLEINMATETDSTIGLRRELQSNSRLARDLYGSEALPMIFQYDPFNYWIESDAERNLLFTLNRLENVSPRIRYNLHDRGLVRPRAEVDAILADHRLSWSALSRSALSRSALSSSASSSSALGPKSSADTSNANGAPLPLPLLFHWGRQNSAVAFYGCKITPEDVQHTILAIPELASRVENFALHPYEDADANKRLELWFELKANVDRLESSEPLTSAVLQGLAHQNQDFRESLRMIPASRRPSLKIFPYGQSPISGQDVRIKRRYIV